MKIALSYSGGKDCILALHRAIQAGHDPAALLTTWDGDRKESHFHRIPLEVMAEAAEKLGIPLILIKTGGEDYNRDFEGALTDLKQQGMEAVVFGDIDIPGHLEWGRERCGNTGLEAMYPLWQEPRRQLVEEFIDAGFHAVIKVVDTRRMEGKYAGSTLSHAVLDALEKEGVDVCGENGEYHTFVFDGPIFSGPVGFKKGRIMTEGFHRILPIC